MLRPTVSRPVCLGIKHPDFYFRSAYGIRLTITLLIPWGALSDERTGLSFGCTAGPCQRSLSRVLVPWDLATVFYCLRFETSLFVASYDSQGHGGGIRPRLHTGFSTIVLHSSRKVKVKVKDGVALRLTVYRQSIHFITKPLEAHN
jgi:hypothetical protein